MVCDCVGAAPRSGPRPRPSPSRARRPTRFFRLEMTGERGVFGMLGKIPRAFPYLWTHPQSERTGRP
jgi:hypothetical protein